MSESEADLHAECKVPLPESGWRWLPLTALVIVLDHVSKAWIMHHFALSERVHVLPVLDIILTYNTGAAFSFLAGRQRLAALGVRAAGAGREHGADRVAAPPAARATTACSPAGWR